MCWVYKWIRRRLRAEEETTLFILRVEGGRCLNWKNVGRVWKGLWIYSYTFHPFIQLAFIRQTPNQAVGIKHKQDIVPNLTAFTIQWRRGTYKETEHSRAVIESSTRDSGNVDLCRDRSHLLPWQYLAHALETYSLYSKHLIILRKQRRKWQLSSYSAGMTTAALKL